MNPEGKIGTIWFILWKIFCKIFIWLNFISKGKYLKMLNMQLN